MTDEEKKNDQIDKNGQTDRNDQIDKNDQIDQMKTNDQIDQKKTNDQMNRQSEKSDSLEDKSLEELHKQIEKGKRKASRSIVFAAAALIAIVSIGVAWFASNSTVTATGSRISAEAPISFLLGSEGQRQNGEIQYLKLDQGTTQNYSSWVNVETKEKISENSSTGGGKTIYIGNTNLAWYLNGQESLVPGANGKLEFYIIPQQSGIKVAEITVKLEAYVVDDTNTDKAHKSTDKVINNLINGHILLFQSLSDADGYGGWLEPNDSGEYTFNVKNPGVVVGEEENVNSDTSIEVFEKGVPYKITLYWVWPNYFRNYIYTQRSTQGDLFTDKSSSSEARKALLEFVGKQNIWNTSRLFYQKPSGETSQQLSSESVISGTIDDKMSDDNLNTCSNYYNQADEYIGNNVQYAYVEVKVTEGTSSDAATSTSKNNSGNDGQ